MLDVLLKVGERLREPLAELLANSRSSGEVQGAFLEFDRYWLKWFYWQWAERARKWQGAFDQSESARHVADRFLFDDIRFDVSDVHTPPDWNRHCRLSGYPESSSPLVIRVILRAPKRLNRGKQATGPRPFERRLNIHDRPIEYQGHPIVYEVRPSARAVSWTADIASAVVSMLRGDGTGENDKGISVGRQLPSPTAGTLGGMLALGDGAKKFMVSCAHVLGEEQTAVYTPGPYEQRQHEKIGVVRFSRLPPRHDVGRSCGYDATPDASRLDLSVAEVLSESALASSSGRRCRVTSVRPASAMVSMQPVSFVGKESGRVDGFLGSVSIWHTIEFADGWRCFGGLFEFVTAANSRKPAALPGDSGAWIVDGATDLPCWNGMLMAAVEGGDRAFGCFAQHIVEACENRFRERVILAS